MTPEHDDSYRTALVAAALFGVVLYALAVEPRQVRDAIPPEPPPARQVISGKYHPIAIYDSRERALTITKDAPRETLICIRGQCKLAEEWIGQ